MCSSTTDSSLTTRVRALAGELAGVQAVSDGELRTRLVELEQARNTLEAVQAAVMVEMHHRAEIEDAAGDARLTPGVNVADHGRLAEFVSDEIGVLLACTRMAAAHRLETAIRANTHQSLMAAWHQGAIDARKVAVIGDSLLDVDPAYANTLAGEAAKYATSRTATQTRGWLSRRVLAADPAMAEVRRAHASESRRVTLMPLADGMAELSALLPGIQARQAFDTLNALAQAAAPGDARTTDQRRADALMDLLTGRAQPPQVQIQVIVPADTLTGHTDQPGWIPGLGPITASETRRVAQNGAQRQRSVLSSPAQRAHPHRRPRHRHPDQAHRARTRVAVPALPRLGPGDPHPGHDLPLPRMPPQRPHHHIRHRPRPHRPPPRGCDPLGQPRRALPTTPPTQALSRLAHPTLPRRPHDLDHTHRPPLPHRTMGPPRTTRHQLAAPAEVRCTLTLTW